MSGYSTAIKHYIRRYREEVGENEGLINPQELAEWAFEHGLHKPNVKTIISVIASDITKVFREEYRTDKHGRRYRAKHAVTSKGGNKTLSLWADIDNPKAPHGHFVKSFGQRRQQIVGDCHQLKTDIDVYNDSRGSEEPIQLVLDFTLDVDESGWTSEHQVAIRQISQNTVVHRSSDCQISRPYEVRVFISRRIGGHDWIQAQEGTATMVG